MQNEVFPTEADQPHIMMLAQAIIDTIQPYAHRHGMTFPAVMSAIGTAAGGLLARAYSDEALCQKVAGQLSIAASEFATAVKEQARRNPEQ